MKPCSRNRERLAWLAMDALAGRDAGELRAHLAGCEGCRQYLVEISTATENLYAAQSRPDIQSSDLFHQKVMTAIRAEESRGMKVNLRQKFQAIPFFWRVALPVVCVSVLALFIFSPVRGFRPVSPTAPQTPLVSRPQPERDPEPTFANYSFVASESIDKLDELLTRQGNHTPPPPRIYTVLTASD